MDEVVCDYISASCVTRFAQVKQNGWTGIMGAACSSLALNNLSVILWLDKCVVAGSRLDQHSVSMRERCESLEILSILGLPSMLLEFNNKLVPDGRDFADAIHLSSELFHARVGSMLDVINLFPPIVGEVSKIEAGEVLGRATFIHLRRRLS
ncbi:hypothetical protein GCM10017774_37910 [Lentzea cavernae]|uniref:Uncharacterized protein n=2 Tax=Lentzea cavernae TaxID=2020703 RepID=A0ABQ3MEB2_9PSEU|nr:hypothetical protein GCM10017774_37910 [Lentzea cavernae]